ncbi:MAG: amidohydrolase family protein [Burkholderiales bacterium]|nr:amidohydrolase family protein [Burkholderiales bacterium]
MPARRCRNTEADVPTTVDAHHHVWSLARGDYGWLTADFAAIHRDFSLKDLAPLREQTGIAGTVLVQAAPTVAETQYLLDVAARSDGVVHGVVGWADLAAPNAIPTLTRLARNPLLKGVRPMLQDMGDDAWILRAEVGRALAALPRLGLRFDALVRPGQLPALLTMIERHPDLAVVIDHAAKPAIAGGMWEPWARLMRAAAASPRVRCKLSGLVTEAGPGWTIDVLRPYVDFLAETFGPQRLMWGSDWPVVNLAGTYQSWYAATIALTAAWSPEDRAALLGGTARRFYGLDEIRTRDDDLRWK